MEILAWGSILHRTLFLPCYIIFKLSIFCVHFLFWIVRANSKDSTNICWICQTGLEKTFQNVNFTFLFERSPAETADSFEGTLKRQLP